MSLTTGGQTNKSSKFSHLLQVDLRIAYAFHISGNEYLIELDLVKWRLGPKHEEKYGFKCWRLGPLKFATMNRDAYDTFVAEKILDVLSPLKDNLEEKGKKMAPVSPTEVPPKDALN